MDAAAAIVAALAAAACCYLLLLLPPLLLLLLHVVLLPPCGTVDQHGVETTDPRSTRLNHFPSGVFPTSALSSPVKVAGVVEAGLNEGELKYVRYHSECRKPIVNKNKIERLKKRSRTDSPVCAPRGPGRPSSAVGSVRPNRSKTIPKEQVCLFSNCDFCPKNDSEPLHRVLTDRGGRRPVHAPPGATQLRSGGPREEPPPPPPPRDDVAVADSPQAGEMVIDESPRDHPPSSTAGDVHVPVT
ncbi:hypothetical protein GWK47_054776 [Chionoecetes opilio]|uniref:Uncharacterized protein n=1 Tax=Chionoecetes opilio TaxID=41210 RepID=A0A8J4Y6Q4_CHIOP|nr:hypothetical protein GWK47_054776 [Chionoecetes opilio]